MTSFNGYCLIEFQKPVPASLIADYDRGGTIDTNDFKAALSGKPFRFWVNDDDDSGYDGGTDIPGEGYADGLSGNVDGVRDLIDFFPVHLDLTNLLAEASYTNGYEYYLCHKEGALNVVETELTPDTAGDYLRDVSTATDLGNDSRDRVDDDGWQIPETFLQDLIDHGQSIVLIEATKETTEPLRLELRKEDRILGSCELPLSITGVEKMFRHVNLRTAAGPLEGPPSKVGDPENNPDSESNGKIFVFIHGFNETADNGYGHLCEVFKRMWWSGSRAKFHGISWFGDESLPTRYHENVINAFETSKALAAYINGLPGEVNVGAFSLGNMVMSSAMQDHGASNKVSRYFMLHAAVAKEAYDGNEYYEGMVYDNDNVHWLDYTNRLWCSEWYKLFESNDQRSTLTWRDRFPCVVPKAYNFYSSGEDVLETFDDTPTVIGALINQKRYTWVVQEKWKGLALELFGGSLIGGWGVNEEYTHSIPGFPPIPWSPEMAAGISTNELKVEPFFNPGSSMDALYHNSGSSFAQEYRKELLAHMIPATSLPVGANEVVKFNPYGERNFDMNASELKNNWPSGRITGEWQYRWLHGDHRKIAYLYTYKVFDEIVEKGVLR